MNTNISISLTDEQRLNLGQKYHSKSKSKKLLTRNELNLIVQHFITNLLKLDTSTKKTIEVITSPDGWKYFYNDLPVTKQEYYQKSKR